MAGQITISTLRDDTGVLATQNGMTGIAKAWINFNGTSGSTSIRASFNVSSITRNGAGDYTVNFTTAMPDANYAVHITANGNNFGGISMYYSDTVLTTSTRVSAGYQPYGSPGFYDCSRVMVTIHGN
jgi:hypothetical protein